MWVLLLVLLIIWVLYDYKKEKKEMFIQDEIDREMTERGYDKLGDIPDADAARAWDKAYDKVSTEVKRRYK